MAAKLALFDFDGTLYHGDSMLDFTKAYVGRRSFYFGLLRQLPRLLGLKLSMLDNTAVKLRYLKFFFSGADLTQFSSQARHFASETIPKELDQHTFARFQEHLTNGDVVVIVTASAADWIAPWSEQYFVPVIGTKLEAINGKLTGAMASKNCYGAEKVSRIRALYQLDSYSAICTYGSGKGDLEMLQLKTP